MEATVEEADLAAPAPAAPLAAVSPAGRVVAAREEARLMVLGLDQAALVLARHASTEVRRPPRAP